MIKTGYKLIDQGGCAPIIMTATVEDSECVSWQEAKKQLRKWYLDQAHQVRSLREKDITND